MKQYIEIICRYCGADDLVKTGRSENGMQRYRCSGCGRSFQHEYKYNAWKPGVKEQIEKQTLNDSQQFRNQRYRQKSQHLSEYRSFRTEKKLRRK